MTLALKMISTKKRMRSKFVSAALISAGHGAPPRLWPSPPPRSEPGPEMTIVKSHKITLQEPSPKPPDQEDDDEKHQASIRTILLQHELPINPDCRFSVFLAVLS
jgi:hypothetical protein